MCTATYRNGDPGSKVTLVVLYVHISCNALDEALNLHQCSVDDLNGYSCRFE